MLRRLYDWMMSYALHPQARLVLAGVAFVESSFFPLPPDPLYLAMLIARRDRAWSLAFLCTISSVLGGLLGYYIGYALFQTAGEWIIETYHLESSFNRLQKGFQMWGFWLIALKGLTPIPFKIVTITSGVVHLNLVSFLVASTIARGFRFFVLAALFKKYGAEIKGYIENNLGMVTLLAFAALIIGYWIIIRL